MTLPALRDADPTQIAAVLYKSGLFADTKSEAQAVVKVLAGQEYGLAPFAAMRGIHIIQGQPVPGAHVLAQAIKRSGHYTFKVVKHTNTECVLEFFQKANAGWESLGVETFTTEDAKRAGLLGKANYQKHPRNMLFARCVANGARFHCPDISGGPILVSEELDEGEPVPVENTATAPALPAAPITQEQVREIADLYLRAGWKEPDEADPHKLLRFQLVALGVPNGAPGEPADLIAGLTPAQYAELHKALASEVERHAGEGQA